MSKPLSSSCSDSEAPSFSSFAVVSSDAVADGSDGESYWSPAMTALEQNLSPAVSMASLSSYNRELSVSVELETSTESQIQDSSSESHASISDTSSLVAAEQPLHIRDDTPLAAGEPEQTKLLSATDGDEFSAEIARAISVEFSTVATLPELTTNQRSQSQLLEDIAAFPEKYVRKFRDIEHVVPCTHELWNQLMNDVDTKLEESGLEPLVDVSYSFLATHYPAAHRIISECAEIIVSRIGGWYQGTFVSRLPLKLEHCDEKAKSGDLAAVVNQLRTVALNQRHKGEIMMIPRFRRKGESMRHFCERFMRNTYTRISPCIQQEWLNEAAPILIGNGLTRHYLHLARNYLQQFNRLPHVRTPERFVDVVCTFCGKL